jgi:hypothetical protein
MSDFFAFVDIFAFVVFLVFDLTPLRFDAGLDLLRLAAFFIDSSHFASQS